MRIKDITLENRPRERLEKQGPSVSSDAELLAIILKTGNRGENAIDMSNRLISKYGFEKLSTCSPRELQEINGIGSAKACQIVALFELNKRHSYSKTNGKSIKTAKDVFEYCSPRMSSLDREQFIILHLDTKNRVIKDEIVSVGALTGTIAHPREVFKSAIKESAHSVILVHNHPSGDPTPSDEDLKMTERLFEAGEILGIKVLDHVIVGKDGWWSWNDHNLNV
ncbi:DNA repair protein RadC [Candidatus Woesearchaeota archaeon]|nr:DNA repair protein RadC [Candidatus Woesearchaeota archaeon]HIJ01135.1 JAB domain-containing protein [Candidatus Woesearchaeota archaeon]